MPNIPNGKRLEIIRAKRRKQRMRQRAQVLIARMNDTELNAVQRLNACTEAIEFLLRDVLRDDD
jgi:hypothetical protein